MKEDNQAKAAALDVAKARKQAAHRITQRNTLYSAGIALLPFPVVDAVILLVLQLSMLRSIARLYKVDFQETLAKSLIGSLAGFA